MYCVRSVIFQSMEHLKSVLISLIPFYNRSIDHLYFSNNKHLRFDAKTLLVFLPGWTYFRLKMRSQSMFLMG
jgi:hypothetical protein